MLRKTALFSALLLAAGSPLVAGASAYEQKVKASLALIGYPVDDKRLTIAFGTGFCVNSSAAKSYYVTNNHVVTDRTGNLAPNLFLIQAKAPGTRLKATVLRHSVDPDLAIVAVTPIPQASGVLAQASGNTSAALGGRGNCFHWDLPVGINAKYVIRAARGMGVAAGQLYSK